MDATAIECALHEDTVPTLFWKAVTERADKVALREKDLGIWRDISWRQYGEQAKQTGLALIEEGLEMGDRVAVLSFNCPEWFYCDMGIMGAGGVTVGVYPTDSASQLEYLINDCGARYLFVEDEEQLDKFLEIRGHTPSLAKAIVFDTEGLRNFEDPQVISYVAFLEIGRRAAVEHPGLWEQRLQEPAPRDLAILIYTSGTTGPPKGAMISHANIVFQVNLANRYIPIQTDDTQISFLPLAHIAGRLLGTFDQLKFGTIVHFAESPETVPDNIREIQPTLMFGVPRVWEKFYSGVSIALMEATPLERMAYAWAIKAGFKMVDCELEGLEPPLALRARYWLADQLVLKNVRRMIGAGNARYAGTGAAPISPDLLRWFMALGVGIREVYGQTENTGLATAAPMDEVKIGSVGKAVDGTEVRLSPEGEILLKGPHVFMGYLNQPEKTAETVIDGWLHTGDVGALDNEGWLRITDRLKDIIVTAGGKNVTPSEIENQLKFSPYISDAVVIGDRRKYLTCLIMIDYDNVANFAQEHSVPFTDFASLTRAPAVVALIAAEVEKVNAQLARVEAIKYFKIIDHELDLEDEELTPTMKLKRAFVNRKYREQIEAMYSGA